MSMIIQGNFQQVLWKTLADRTHNLVPIPYCVYTGCLTE